MSQTTPTTPPTGPVRPWRPTPGPWQPTVTPITVIDLDPDPLCGHLPGEPHNGDECAYWQGVQLGWYPAPDLTAGRAA